MDSTTEAFIQAIANAGLTPPDRVIADGKIHRFATNGNRGDDSGWYVFFDDDSPAGAFGDWRSGLKHDWCGKHTRAMSPKERAAHAKHLASIKRQREDEERRRQSDAAAKARRVWEAAKPSSDEHPYLVRKQVKSHGLRRQRDGRLIVPLRDTDGAMHSVGFIDDDGVKKFLTGGRKRGCCYTLGQIADLVHLCEGYATGASVHEATGLPVAVAFDAGNLKPAAQALRAKYPKATVILCADNDASGVGQKAARDAAEAVGGVVAIPETAGDDWNDVHSKHGLAAVKREIEAALSAMRTPTPNAVEVPSSTPGTVAADVALQIETAEDPEPIALETISLPPLPTSCIPIAWLRNMIEAVTAATETPAELPTVLALAVIATAAQRQWCIEISRSHVEQLSFWACAALSSGERKSGVLKVLTRPLVAFEQQQAAALSPVLKAADAARKLTDDRIKHLRHKAARATGGDADWLRHELQREETSAPEVPREPRYWTQDVTPEKLASLMADHGGAMALLSDEAGFFDILGGRYSQGIPNLDLVLQAFSGMPVRVDRGSRESVFLHAPKLTICVTPQPSVLQGLARQPSFRGRGLLARFFYAVPRSTLGYRRLDDRPIPEAAEARYDAAITALLDRLVSEGDLRRLTFSPDAHAEWKAYQRHLETEMRPGGAFQDLTDWASKAPGGAARIAGIFHCAKHAHGEPADHLVDIETTTAALTLSAVFERHAVAAFGMMGTDVVVESAKRVLAWIQQGRHRTFSRREVFNALRGQFPTVESLRPALLSLEERSLIFPVAEEKRAGRPTHRFRVNTQLIGGWA